MLMSEYMRSTRGPVTRWKNGSRDEVRLRLYVGPPAPSEPRAEDDVFVTTEIGPGEVAELPSEFDGGIHQLSRQDPSLIVGGLAPQLICLDHPERVLHPALIPTTVPVLRPQRRRV